MGTQVTTAFKNRHYQSVPWQDGLVFDQSGSEHPTVAYAWGAERSTLRIDRTVLPGQPDEATALGYVTSGMAWLTPDTPAHQSAGASFPLVAGTYFSVPSGFTVAGGAGVVVMRLGYRGMFQVGGPIEAAGRLRYIDGCTDSLLIPPVLKGDACLNHLHFPPGISQTRHTHPSIRLGVVARGRGRCVVPANDDGSGEDVSIPLQPGLLFLILPGGHHSFFTDEEGMDVIAYHPDSDVGPEHERHPMITRTIVGGTPASELPGIQTTAEQARAQ